jgi:hypothetical protein
LKKKKNNSLDKIVRMYDKFMFLSNDTDIEDAIRQVRVNKLNSKLNKDLKASDLKHRKMVNACGEYNLATQ